MSEPKRKRQLKPLTDKQGEVMPELIEAVDRQRKKLGRPKSETPKVHVGFRLSADLVERIRESGPGYNARVEEALRKGFMGTKRRNGA
jgi:uncharacterized protein (DUF4415 family)